MNSSISFNDILMLLKRVKPLGIQKPQLSPATNEEILRFQKQYGVRLPNELRDWLLLCNGANVNPGGLYGLRSLEKSISIEACLDREPIWIEKQWLPIANDGCGDYYVLAAKELVPYTTTNPVFFIDQSDYGRVEYVVASSLRHFLWFLFTNELLSEEGLVGFWPFDKGKVLAVDPALANVEHVALPWDR